MAALVRTTLRVVVKPRVGLGQFSFSMPHEFEVRKSVARDNKLQSTELMPPTLDGKAGNSSIDYQVIVDVKRRGILQADASYV